MMINEVEIKKNEQERDRIKAEKKKLEGGGQKLTFGR
jgi:hypothetical protein